MADGNGSDSGLRNATARLSENTNVRLGLALVLAGYVVGTTWWAATLQGKVDSLLTMTAANAAVQQSASIEIAQLRERVLVLEQRARP